MSIVYLLLLISFFLSNIDGFTIEEKEFTVMKNKRISSSSNNTCNAETVIECAAQCAQKPGCSVANFISSVCEMFSVTPGAEIQLNNERECQYMCKTIVFITMYNIRLNDKIYIATNNFRYLSFNSYVSHTT